MSDEWRRMLKEVINCELMNVHTSFPGSVVEYNAKTRRAKIQPYLKREMPDGTFMNFPVIHDVPVRFFGTKKYTVHLPLEVDDEVEVNICERATDIWRDKGAVDNEDPDPRRFSIMDAYATPGLQPIEFIDTPEDGLMIKHKTAWDGKFISHVHMNDTKVEVKYKEKAKVLMEDDKIECTTDGNTFSMTGKNVDTESPNPIGIKGTGTQLGSGVLRPFWNNFKKAAGRNPLWIPPLKWPRFVPVPPVPPLINMAMNGFLKDTIAACTTAIADGNKVLK